MADRVAPAEDDQIQIKYNNYKRPKRRPASMSDQ